MSLSAPAAILAGMSNEVLRKFEGYPRNQVFTARCIQLLSFFMLFLLWVVILGESGRGSAKSPNLVLIMSDDMGYSDVGCFGGEIQTPRLDGLASRGLRYTQFYNTSRCCPTRASLLTGLYPHQAGVGHMMEDRGTPAYRGDLSFSAATIAEVLGPAYATFMSGKWHVTPSENRGETYNWPLQRGFDRFFGTIRGAGSFFDPGTLVRGNEYITPGEDFYYTDAISDEAVRFIREQKSEQPFFLYVSYTAAHWPLHARPRDIAKYDGIYSRGWDALRRSRFEQMVEMGLVSPGWELSPPDPAAERWEFQEDPQWQARCMEVYAAQVDSMDQGIGRILDALESRGELENTLIVYLQDNGACAEEIGRWERRWTEEELELRRPMEAGEFQWDMIPEYTRDGRPVRQGRGVMPGPADTYLAYGASWANASNTPFRMYKHWVHEGGIATPLIVHWPAGIVGRGEFRQQPGHLIDLMATFVDVAGVEYPTKIGDREIEPLEGVSLVPSFENHELEREKPLFWEHEGNRAIRDGKWKLVSKAHSRPREWAAVEELPLREWELYDLERDRSELNDLAKEFPDRVRLMADEWQRWAERTGVVPMP